MAKGIAQFTIVDLNDITTSATAPANPVANMIWLDTSVVPNKLKRYTGTAWVDAGISKEALDNIQEQMDNVNQNLSTKINTLQTSIEATSKAITLKAEQSTVDSLNKAVEEYKTSFDLTAKGLTIQIDSVKSTADNAQKEAKELGTYFSYDDSGLTIGKKDSLMQVTISNTDIEFKDNGKKVAFINGKKMYIDSLDIISSAIIGVHQIEKYDDNTTFIKWVGKGNN